MTALSMGVTPCSMALRAAKKHCILDIRMPTSAANEFSPDMDR